MAKNDDTGNDSNSLIGYDPLAWMDQESEDYAAASEILAEDEIEALQQAGGINNADSLSIDDSSQDQQDGDGNDDADDSRSPVHLDATLSIQNVATLHEKLKKVLSANDLIEINASDVASIDTASLQLLVALKKDAVRLQKTVIFDSPSPRFIESAKLLGLLGILDV